MPVAGVKNDFKIDIPADFHFVLESWHRVGQTGRDNIVPDKRKSGENKLAALISLGVIDAAEVGAVDIDHYVGRLNAGAVGLLKNHVTAKLPGLG